MGEAIVFTSGKGGVGKTTTIANIGVGLSQLDKKVVMLDTDMGLRNLDVVMGLEDRITYNLLDLLENKCRLKQCLIKDKRYANLYMIPASLKYKRPRQYEQNFHILVSNLKTEFDYVLIDCPAGIDDGFYFAISAADRVVLVTNPSVSSVRDAGRVICLLEQKHYHNVELLVNETDEKLIKRRDMLSAPDIEEILGVPLIGSIPIDNKVLISQNRGLPVICVHRSPAARAYHKISRNMLVSKVHPINLAEEGSGLVYGEEITI